MSAITIHHRRTKIWTCSVSTPTREEIFHSLCDRCRVNYRLIYSIRRFYLAKCNINEHHTSNENKIFKKLRICAFSRKDRPSLERVRGYYYSIFKIDFSGKKSLARGEDTLSYYSDLFRVISQSYTVNLFRSSLYNVWSHKGCITPPHSTFQTLHLTFTSYTSRLIDNIQINLLKFEIM